MWGSFQQKHRYIVHIGAGGAGDEQAVHRREGVVGVVLGQHGGNVQPAYLEYFQGKSAPELIIAEEFEDDLENFDDSWYEIQILINPIGK